MTTTTRYNIDTCSMIVEFNASVWTARKLDKKATKDVADINRASTSAGRYNKSLLPLNDLLANVHQKTGLIREKFAKNTLPWGIDGTRILPSANYLTFMQDFRKEKGEWQYLVQNFIDNYDTLVDEAKRWLGDLYDEKDYPARDKIVEKFNMDMAILPVPTNDFRVELSSDELTRLQEEMEGRMASVQQEAMMDAWGRLYKHVQHIAEKLAALNEGRRVLEDGLGDKLERLYNKVAVRYPGDAIALADKGACRLQSLAQGAVLRAAQHQHRLRTRRLGDQGAVGWLGHRQRDEDRGIGLPAFQRPECGTTITSAHHRRLHRGACVG